MLDSPLLELPDELLDAILSYLPLESLLNTQLVCKRLRYRVSNDLQWARHCIEQYKFWETSRDFKTLLRKAPGSVRWKKLLQERRSLDRKISSIFEQVLSQQYQRIAAIGTICQHEFDAKDFLLKQMACDDDAPDVLARRFWASQILGSVERNHGLKTWMDLRFGEDVPLEHALGAFDLLIAEKPPETLEMMSTHLDMLVKIFKETFPDQEKMTLRTKACTLAEWMCTQDLTNVESHNTFRDVQNTLISIALCESHHPSIPIISVAIYCALANRLGLDAHPINYPGRIYAIILPPPNQTVDGETHKGETTSRLEGSIYIDPCIQGGAISLADLKQQLYRAHVAQTDDYLAPTTSRTIVDRNANNIIHSLSEGAVGRTALETVSPETLLLHNIDDQPTKDSYDYPAYRSPLITKLPAKRAFYACLWSKLLFAPSEMQSSPNRIGVIRGLEYNFEQHNSFARLCQQLQEEFALDVDIFENIMNKLLDSQFDRNIANSVVRAVREQDSDFDCLAAPRPRSVYDPTNKVKHRIGSVFVHRKYRYTGAIYGWDIECKADDDWINQNGVDRLGDGRGQCFYHVLDEDASRRYVAEENIVIVTGEDAGKALSNAEGLWSNAGRWFKRFDKERGCFVSNLQERFPDN